MTENEISYGVRGAIFEVFRELGPGLLETVYQAALIEELEERGFRVAGQVEIPVRYKRIELQVGFRMDLLVEDKVLVEIKAIENLGAVHHKQVLTYLKLSGLKLGLLVNFNAPDIKQGIFRKVNGL